MSNAVIQHNASFRLTHGEPVHGGDDWLARVVPLADAAESGRGHGVVSAEGGRSSLASVGALEVHAGAEGLFACASDLKVSEE